MRVPNITKEKSPNAYKLGKPVHGIFSIKPVNSDDSSDTDEEEVIKPTGNDIYFALYTNDKTVNFCKFLKFTRTENGWQHKSTSEPIQHNENLKSKYINSFIVNSDYILLAS